MIAKINPRMKLTSIALIAVIMFLIYGCKSSNLTQPASGNLNFSSTSSNSGNINNPVILEIDVAKVLIKDIKLNVAEGPEGQEGKEENFKVGPFILYLDLSSSLNVISTGAIPPGTYDRVKFEIHKVNPNEALPDPDFIDGSGRYSVIVKGHINGIPFVFKSSVSAHQILAFPRSLFVNADGKSNITLKADPFLWFFDNGMLLDPTIESNKDKIEYNIINNVNNNIKIFVDNDEDGRPD